MWKAIKWLFWQSPLHIQRDNTKRKCDFCGNDNNWTHFESEDRVVCNSCLFKALDAALNKENN